MNRFTKRPASRRTLFALVAAGVLAASAAVVTTNTLAQNRPERGGFDRRDRGNGNGGNGNGYGNGADRQGGDRQGFDRSRRSNNNGNGGTQPGGLRTTALPPQQTSPASSPSGSATQPATEAAPPPPPPMLISLKPSDYARKYLVLEEKNIFLKARRPRPVPGERDRNNLERIPRKPEETLVLRGIALQEGRRVGFVENTSNNTTARLTPGTAILSGKIVEVGGDYIAYESDAGQKTRIDIGHNFAGAVATGGFGPSGYGSGGGGGGSFTVTGSASASSSAAPPDPNNPNLSVEEKMKLKRLQEQQKPQ